MTRLSSTDLQHTRAARAAGVTPVTPVTPVTSTPRLPRPCRAALAAALLGTLAAAPALAADATAATAQAAPAALSSPHAPAALQRDPLAVADPKATFAVVDGQVILAGDFQRALQVAARNRYYHAKPPEGELALLKREVGTQVIDRVLLLREATRRAIPPDAAKVQAEIAAYDQRYAGNAVWAARREAMLAMVKPQLEDESRLDRLGALVRQVGEPDDAALQAYYAAHPALFIEPERFKLSVILLKVDPSSPQAVWDAAHAEAQAVHRRLLAGADFAELARLHSSDRSAASGGALEYVHRGMLPEAVHGLVDALAPGQVGAPVQLLEGVAILRLDERKPALQRRLDEVRARCAELWQRDTAQAQWQALLDTLRRSATIRVDESHYGAQPGPDAQAG